MSDPILVVGASGVLGSEICRRLREVGCTVRALVREESSGKQELAELGCELVVGDLLNPASLERACSGVEQVVNTATSIGTLKKGQSMASIDRDGLLALVAAAEKTSVENFVFISVPPSAENIQFIRYKRLIEARLRDSPLRASILQPGAFMESAFGPASGWDIARGTAKMIGDGQARTNWISASDVAKAAVAACLHPELQGRDLPIGGPEILSAREVLAIFEGVYDKKAKVQVVPRWVVRTLSKLMMPFKEDVASIMAIISSDVSRMEVETALDLRPHLEPMVTVREFATRQRGV